MPLAPFPAWSLLAVVAAAGAGCAVGSGGDPGDCGRDLGLAGDAPYVVADLGARAVMPLAEVPVDLDSDPRWRTSAILFRRIPAVEALTVGLPVDRYAAMMDADDGDEGHRFAASSRQPLRLDAFYLSVFEITRGQWRRLAGDGPWLGTGVRGAWTTFDGLVGDGQDERLPACAVSARQIDALLAAQDWCRLVLPSRNQWEYACRGTATTPFPWGDGTDDDVVGPFAVLQADNGVTSLARAQPTGPAVVGGGRTANAFGLWDMQGNVAECTAERDHATGEALVCGGSWADVVRTARATNAVRIADDLPHPLVGLRLVVTP